MIILFYMELIKIADVDHTYLKWKKSVELDTSTDDVEAPLIINEHHLAYASIDPNLQFKAEHQMPLGCST